MEAASPPLSFLVSAGRGYGAAPPGSRALRVATRRAYGPPLTPEPLRPLTAQRHGQEQSPARPNARRSQPRPTKQSLYGSRGLPYLSTAQVVSGVQAA
jgi:hypothetical protein